MPIFRHEVVLNRPPQDVFEFLCTTANRIRLLPPDTLEFVSGPPVLDAGVQTTWKMRRYGLSQTIVQKVTACEAPTRLVEEQVQGPLQKCEATTTCMPCAEGTRLLDVIDFAPPGGMLGLLLTSAKIGAMLAESFAWRDQQLRELLESSSSARPG